LDQGKKVQILSMKRELENQDQFQKNKTFLAVQVLDEVKSPNLKILYVSEKSFEREKILF
jgi:hypothetical protein